MGSGPRGQVEIARWRFSKSEDVGGKLQPAERVETALVRAQSPCARRELRSRRRGLRDAAPGGPRRRRRRLPARFLRAGGARAARPARLFAGDRPTRGGDRGNRASRGSARPSSSISARRATTPGDAAEAKPRSATPWPRRRWRGGRTSPGSRARTGSSSIDRCALGDRRGRDREARESEPAAKDPTRVCRAPPPRLAAGAAARRLYEAGRDNAEARRLAEETRDRLEIGELWLEEGDRRAYDGDREGARSAWDGGAAPPDRCPADRFAQERLAELLDRLRRPARASARPDVGGALRARSFISRPSRRRAGTLLRPQLPGASGLGRPAFCGSRRVGAAARVFGRPRSRFRGRAAAGARRRHRGAFGRPADVDGALPRSASPVSACAREGGGREILGTSAEPPAPAGVAWRPVDTGAGLRARALADARSGDRRAIACCSRRCCSPEMRDAAPRLRAGLEGARHRHRRRVDGRAAIAASRALPRRP